MTRHPDWPERLAAVLEAWRDARFSWGERDCAHFALACLSAVSVCDWQSLAVGRYRSRQDAARQLGRLGVRDITALADRLLGPRCAPPFIRRGDLVALAGPDGPALGVCLGGCAAAMSAAGLAFKPFSDISAGWRI